MRGSQAYKHLGMPFTGQHLLSLEQEKLNVRQEGDTRETCEEETEARAVADHKGVRGSQEVLLVALDVMGSH